MKDNTKKTENGQSELLIRCSMFINHKQLRNEEKYFKNNETLYTIIFPKTVMSFIA